MHKIIQQGRCSALEDAVADKLRDPARDMDGQGVVVSSRAIRRGEMGCMCSAAEEERREERTGEWLHEDIEEGVERCEGRSEVKGKVGGQGRGGKEVWGICRLQVLLIEKTIVDGH